MKKQPLGIYIHWPFCTSKCPYCDFSSIVRNNIDESLWTEALLKNLERYKHLSHSHAICSIFFGGGTPSLMTTHTIEKIIKRICKLFDIESGVEITIEANPSTFSLQKLKDLYNAGINRLSIGVQSFQPESLRFLGRNHSVIQAHNGIEDGLTVFKNVSIDLIFGYHNQTQEMWLDDLHNAIQHHINHLSCYQLTFEKNTPFYQLLHSNQIQHISDEEELSFAQLTKQALLDTHLQKYETSNWAQGDKQCIHNMLYWRYQDYLGIGPSAHSRITYNIGCNNTIIVNEDLRVKKQAIEQIRSPEAWLKAVLSEDNQPSPCNNQDAMKYKYLSEKRYVLSYKEMTYEKILMGLRLKEGVRLTEYDTKHLNTQKIIHMEDILSYDYNILKTRNQGEFLINYILSEILL